MREEGHSERCYDLLRLCENVVVKRGSNGNWIGYGIPIIEQNKQIFLSTI